MKLDWSHWIYGLISGFIGGGASAVTAGLTVSIQVPEKYNFGTSPKGLEHLLFLMLIVFVANGLLTAFAYLKQSPLPAVEPEPPTPAKP